ncbi:fumarylacetoacetase [Xylophilus sp.]|uniref:fumarylacetoacetase n=1 Tax=Xylophilus sp. TaxID=2653893 RepID=UPI0013B71169|nr:fumarylacetoacetase [Xylophilus sp.]KAF1042935.1 MAG: putative protein YisK [Xylophilus sp.]
MSAPDRTHDPALRSWVASANRPDHDFPIQNLPFGAFRAASDAAPRCAVAIGDQLLDVSRIADLFTAEASAVAAALAAPGLNRAMALGHGAHAAFRAQLSALLQEDERARRPAVEAALRPLQSAQLVLPFEVRGYTDFFASIHHASNAGRLFRPDQPLLPNYRYVPVAYNGRANSVRTSGEPVVRPHGQLKPAEAGAAPRFAPSQRMDYEVELGIVVGRPTAAGEPLRPGDAWDHVFGFCLLNDWSARDIQAWEYQPLGPFLGKSFATSISPWIVTAQALLPFRTAAAARAPQDPEPLPHLRDPRDHARGAVAVQLEAAIRTAHMRQRGLPAHRLSRSNAADLYWTVAQMLAHHTSNGCALDTGDLVGSGTVSGAGDGALGSLLELSRGGAAAIDLPGGEQRRFLEDGDEVRLTGFCEAPGHRRIGFGECAAVLAPARPYGPADSGE